jgi:urease accessory protein
VYAAAGLVAQLDVTGVTRPTSIRSEAPLLLRARPSTAGPLDVFMVGGAAGPLGGDCLSLAMQIGEGASVVVRSVAAMLAQPSPIGGASTLTTTADIGVGAHVDWWPEPLISVRGSDHTSATTVRCAAGAHVRWVDEIVLGRTDESSGRLTIRQRIEVGGRPLLHHDVVFDPAESPLGRHGPFRVIVTAASIGPASEPASTIITNDVRATRTPLSDTATTWIALAHDLTTARETLATLGLTR